MIPENVTLIVKAPNQQIEDQNIECQSSWTVKQLKGHLSDVYPNKPRTEEQKIIYSGQLLDDSTILKDVLRIYENQITHTMHLVCTPKKMPEPARTPATEGLRHRNVEPEVIPRAETSQNHQNHTVEMQNYLNSAMNNYGRVPPYPNYNLGAQMPAQDAASLANQMLMMQQAYMQYMQQYALWQASFRAEGPAGAPAPPAPAAPAAPAPAPAPPADDEEAHRDWLDHLYAASRLAVLSSLIYLYGSGARLLLVIVLAVAGYLHQIGFFRDLNLNRNQNQPAGNQNQPAANQNQPAGNQNQGNQPNPNGIPANPNGNPANPNGNPANPNGNPANQNGNPTNPNGNQPETEQPVDDQRSLWSFTWMVFTTFFASLIPDANHQ